ncbi:hypothetical protein [Yinghuangia seranimata]|nr:hypothetical protein [Yinghuangia seranimata]MDI2129436.1 hypothetical protein [Yinghuangia seranimata]
MQFALALVAPTREAFIKLRRDLRRALDPQRGTVIVAIAEPDGNSC